MATREAVLDTALGKKEFQGIERSFALSVLEKHLRQNPLLAKKLPDAGTRSALFRQAVKGVRAALRRSVGLFAGSPKHRELLLAELRQARNPERLRQMHEELLAAHLSTKERLPHYTALYESIFLITGKPKSILDVGCGLNPVSFSFSGLPKSAQYVAVDVDAGVCSFLNEYFSAMKMNGEARVLDARNVGEIRKLPPADVAFVFKLLELLEKGEGHKQSEELLRALPARWVVVSFPTLTSGGRPMRKPRRAWMELMLKRVGWTFTTIRIPNELFYVIRKE